MRDLAGLGPMIRTGIGVATQALSALNASLFPKVSVHLAWRNCKRNVGMVSAVATGWTRVRTSTLLNTNAVSGMFVV